MAAQTGATTRELTAPLGHATPAAAHRYQHAATRRDTIIAAALDVIVAQLQLTNEATLIPLLRGTYGAQPLTDPLRPGGTGPETPSHQVCLESERRESNPRSQLGKCFRDGPEQYARVHTC